jgi:hypothetical protein
MVPDGFDMIVVSRFDVLFHTPFDLHLLNPDIFFTSH